MLVKRPIILIACALSTISTLHAFAQNDAPFGLRMGTARDEVLRVVGSYRETQPGFFQVLDVPEKDADFEGYGLVVSPTMGLCKIMAVSKDVPLNASGDRLKDTFAKIAASLDERYGKHEIFDYLKAESFWKGSENWSMALAKRDRVLAGTWTPPASTGLGSVLLESVASKPDVGYLELHFESENFLACRDELAKSQRTAF